MRDGTRTPRLDDLFASGLSQDGSTGTPPSRATIKEETCAAPTTAARGLEDTPITPTTAPAGVSSTETGGDGTLSGMGIRASSGAGGGICSVPVPRFWWADATYLRPGLYFRRRRILRMSMWLLRPRYSWNTRGYGRRWS